MTISLSLPFSISELIFSPIFFATLLLGTMIVVRLRMGHDSPIDAYQLAMFTGMYVLIFLVTIFLPAYIGFIGAFLVLLMIGKRTLSKTSH